MCVNACVCDGGSHSGNYRPTGAEPCGTVVRVYSVWGSRRAFWPKNNENDNSFDKKKIMTNFETKKILNEIVSHASDCLTTARLRARARSSSVVMAIGVHADVRMSYACYNNVIEADVAPDTRYS